MFFFFFGQDAEEGLVAYEDCGVKLTVTYHIKDLEGAAIPQLGDKVGNISSTSRKCVISAIRWQFCSYFIESRDQQRCMSSQNTMYSMYFQACGTFLRVTYCYVFISVLTSLLQCLGPAGSDIWLNSLAGGVQHK